MYGVKNYDFSAEKNTELRNILLSESIKKNQSNPPEELQDFNFYEYGGFINNNFAVGGKNTKTIILSTGKVVTLK